MLELSEQTCTKCLKTKPITDFVKSKQNTTGYRKQCRFCKNEQRKALYITDNVNAKLFYRKGNLSKYDLTIAQYDQMAKDQNYCCAICKKPETKLSPLMNQPYELCVDHCHFTSKVRGLLCSTCNRALGLFKDNKHVLLEAINYLVKSGG